MERIGKRVKELREKHGYTLRYVGEQLDIDYSYLGKIEKGTTSSIPTLEKLANFYEVDISYFFGKQQPLPKELSDRGGEWLVFGEEMEERNLTPEELKKMVDFLENFNKNNS